MTSTNAPASAPASESASYPLPRSCPVDLPDGLAATQEGTGLTRVRLAIDGSDVWLATRHADVCQVLKDTRFSANVSRQNFPAKLISRPPGPGVLFVLDPPEHTKVRKALAGEFTRARADRLRPAMQGIVDRAVDDMLAAGPPVEFVSAYARPVPLLVLCEVLGAGPGAAEFILDRTRRMDRTGVTLDERQAARDELEAWVRDLVEQKLAAPDDGLVSRIVHDHEAKGELTRDETVGVLTVLILVGFETTTATLSLGVLMLDQHPEWRDRMREDPSLVPGFIEEVMRHQTTADYGARRVAIEDVEVGGQQVRAGDGIIAVLAAGNRDEAVFDDPDRFDPERDTRNQLGFGFGIHFCIGQYVARAQMQLTFETLVRRLPGLHVAAPFEDLVFRHQEGTNRFLHGLEELPVAW